MRAWLWYAGTGAAGVLAAALLIRRGRGRKSLAGIWSDDTTKLKSVRGDEATIIWKLPPGPVPSGSPEERRAAYRSTCERSAGAHGVPGRTGPASWMRPMIPTHPNYSEKYGKDPWRKTAKQPVEWWTKNGTCPGCSAVCGSSCYAARAKNYYDWGTRRVPITNLCDLMAGKGIPKIRLATLEGKTRIRSGRSAVLTPQTWSPEYGPKARMLGTEHADYWTNEVVVDPAKVRRLYVRVHETGDFFDAEYTKMWLQEAKRYVDTVYPTEWKAFRAGKRETPPPRIFWWAYTRSWKDLSIRPLLRKFAQLRYPADCWSRADGMAPHVDPMSKKMEYVPGEACEKEQDAFAVILSADGDTGVPWMKDERGRVMPVAYLYTDRDAAQTGAIINRVPGVVLQDYSLRRQLAKSGMTEGAMVCKSEARTKDWQKDITAELAKYGYEPEQEDKARHIREVRLSLEEIDKQHKKGCGECGYCRPENITKMAAGLWRKYIREARAGVDAPKIARWEMLRRSDDLTDYERFESGPSTFEMAVPRSQEIFEELLTEHRKNKWTRKRLEALRLLQAKAYAIPVVGAPARQ